MAVNILNQGFTFTYAGGDPSVWLIEGAGGTPAYLIATELWNGAPPSGATGHMTVTSRFATPAYSGATYVVSSALTLRDVASTTDYYNVNAVVGRGDGGAVVLIEREASPGGDLAAQFVTSGGALGASYALTGTATQAYFGSGLARLNDGRFLLTYSDAKQTSAGFSDVEIYAQVLDANGAAVGARVALTNDPVGSSGGGELIAAGGGFVQLYAHVSKAADGALTGWGLRTQRLDAAGVATGAATTVRNLAAGDEPDSYTVRSLATGGCIAFWIERSAGFSGSWPPPAGYSQSWSVRYAMLDAAGAVVSSGQLEAGAWSYDGTVVVGTQQPDITAVDLANGGAALEVSNYNFGAGVSNHLYTFDRFGLVATDLALNLAPSSSLAAAANDATLAVSYLYDSLISSYRTVSQFVRIAPGGVIGGAGAETLFGDAIINDVISGGAGNDTLYGLSGGDTLSGGSGDDRLLGGPGDDLLQGDAGVDTADYRDALSAVVVNLSMAGAQATGGGGSDTLTSIESLVGSAFADTLTGDAGANTLIGGAGDDTLNGGAGNDLLIGEVGNDTMLGGAGNDSIFAGDGINYGYGGDGNDVLVGGKDFNVLSGDAGDDYMYLYNAGGQAYGGAGNDVAVGNNANDVFVMGDGNDVAYGYGANDYFYMGAGADVMYGGDGVDVLLGEAGGDYFDGGAGIDYLFLGANDGAVDTVYMDRTSGVDVVNNFEAGRDVLRLVGTGFTGMADVLAATSDYGSLSIITIDANTAVWLIGVTPAQLAASSVALG